MQLFFQVYVSISLLLGDMPRNAMNAVELSLCGFTFVWFADEEINTVLMHSSQQGKSLRLVPCLRLDFALLLRESDIESGKGAGM